MSPSHSRKKGVNYRYYVSQALLQSRKEDAGQVVRVPAPEIEASIGRSVRDHCKDQQTDLRFLIEARIARITVDLDFVTVEFVNPGDDPLSSSRQIISLPWSKKPFREAKGVLAEPASLAMASDLDPKARETLLYAIGRAKRWVDQLMAGGTVSEIATREGKSPRYIQLLTSLAFVPPRLMSEIINGHRPYTATDLAGHVPLVW